MKLHKFILFSFTGVILLAACSTNLPTEYDEKDELPKIYPDYVDVTIPANIAPLTFELDEEADGMIARYQKDGVEVICEDKMQPSKSQWKQLTAQAGDIDVDVFVRHGDRWTHYRPFSITVSPDSIDPWLSYRLIPPSYISYEALTISQRCLENYDERVIYDNILCGFEVDGQCINCHHYQQYNPERMQFHARQNHGGTLIAYEGKMKKVNMKSDSILSAGVYPAWHPWLKLIVYSTDQTNQNFHTLSRNKVEVYDSKSDLIAYNIDTNEVTNIENRDDELEVFPAWAPDGRTLYFCSAHFVHNDSIKDLTADIVANYDKLHYNIYKKSFDPETMQFGPRELVLDAEALNLSAALPRISPDGRWMIFTMAKFGHFHIWHHDADLWMMEVKSDGVKTAQPITAVNSDDTESYHSWSSNGRWLVVSSRRDDGTFTRPFFAHVDKEGHWSKPFELPQQDPDYHRQFLRSYNIPEFMHGPVKIAPQTFADVLKGEGESVKYVQRLSK